MNGIGVSEQKPFGGGMLGSGDQSIALARDSGPRLRRADYVHGRKRFRNGPGLVRGAVVYHGDSKANSLLVSV